MNYVELQDGSLVTITGDGTPTIIPKNARPGPDKYDALVLVERALDERHMLVAHREFLEEWLVEAVHHFKQWTLPE